ncbi:hypothetical protein RI367_006464 [Sorochytrium milnesiophthora]
MPRLPQSKSNATSRTPGAQLPPSLMNRSDDEDDETTTDATPLLHTSQPLSARGGSSGRAAGSLAFRQQQQQQQLQLLQQEQVHDSEIDHHDQVIAQRDGEIQEIEHGIHLVSEIFRDLGTLVHEQGGMLDNIESNVSAVAVHTENADVELVRANKYQQSSRNIKCCLLIVFAIILAVVILVVVL